MVASGFQKHYALTWELIVLTNTMINFFKIMGNEDRIRIVLLLHEKKELFAQNIQHHFYLQQSTTSHHLNKMQKCGVLKTRKEGRHIYYSVNYEMLYQSIDTFKEILITDPLKPTTL